jgi:uncharacterized protein
MSARRLRRAVLCAAALLLPLLLGQGPEQIRSRYAKSELEIRMRDGTRLFTVVYAPRDASRQYPILLTRTPYGVAPYGAENYPVSLGPSDRFADDGYIFAYQDVRGRQMSDGTFENMRPFNPEKHGSGDIDESSDAYDTIDWLVRNVPNNNGRVGMWGISYPGFYAAIGAIDAHPALKAVSPQAPIADWFIGDDFHHNGALFLAHAFNFFADFGQPSPRHSTVRPPLFQHGTTDGYSFFLNMGGLPNANEKYLHGRVQFWNDLMSHPIYDAFWQARNTRTHLKGMKPAIMIVGGWFDAEDLFGALNTYKSIEKESPGAYNILVMGPWYHGGWSRSDGETLGNVKFGSRTGVFFREEIEFPFFSHFLKGNGELKLPEAYVFETGRNQWRRYDTWPPRQAEARKLYLEAGSSLSLEPPKSGSSPYDEYVSDPDKPVPFIGDTAIGMIREYMVEDQRFASRRPDVLTFQTEPLHSDTTVAGPVIADLQVSTTGTDSDWIIKLVDAYPENPAEGDPRMAGYEQLVRGEPMRGKFRNSYEKPEPFVPGQITRVEFTLPDVNHTFLRGHRIMVQVQSSWFPLVDRNPQQFLDIYKASAADFRKATQRVYHAKENPSFVQLNFVK